MLLFCTFQFCLQQICPKFWIFSMFGWTFKSSGAHTACSLNFGMDQRSFVGFAICIYSESTFFLLYHKAFQVALFQLQYRLHVKSQYSRYKWYYKTRTGVRTGPIFHPNDTRKDKQGHHLGYSTASFKADSSRQISIRQGFSMKMANSRRKISDEATNLAL